MNRTIDVAFSKNLGEKRVIDRIVLVADDIAEMANTLNTTFDFRSFEIEDSDNGKTAMVTLDSGIELFLIQPEDNGSVYSRYFKKYGKGIMGIRERITLAQAGLWKTHIDKNDIVMIEEKTDCWWLDLTDSLGLMYGLNICEEELAPTDFHKHIGQICITVNDCEKAAEDLYHYIGKGPWEIGFINNKTTSYLASSQYSAEDFPEGEMRVGMGWFSNLEFEVIEPTKGPMPYFKFLKRHGNGFHHIKERIPSNNWKETCRHYADAGIGVALAGMIGPCEFNNLDTEDLLGCVYELGDDHIMKQLPEGYGAYMYPAVEE